MMKEIWVWIVERLVSLWRGFLGLLGKLWRLMVGSARDLGWRRWRVILTFIPLGFFVYIIIGMQVMQRIDDDITLRANPPAGGSHLVAQMVSLLDREVNTYSWTANDPVVSPGWWLDNTPNYQKGMIGALSRVSLELRDQLGRMRGSSAVDSDLESAAGNLAVEPDRWIMDMKSGFLPTRASETFYRSAIAQLRAYNERVAKGDAVYERRTDNLLATLDRIALDLGASSAALDGYIRDNSGGLFVDYGSDDLFFQTKGQVYAYLMMLIALEADFKDVITGRELTSLFAEFKASLASAAALYPWYVANGAIDGLMANHLSMQGFYLLRARTQLREITNILLK